MAVGDRIKRVRNFRGMTMKELGMAVGFDEKSADVRIAQYENNSRKPKEELMRKIAAALDVSQAAAPARGDHPRGISGMEAELAFHRRRLREVQTEKSVEKRIKT